MQYREVQGNESSLFLSYFKASGGVHYLPGGVDSGFRKVERDVYETRLLHLKGKRTVRISNVPVARTSLNSGDVFLLDSGLKIYLFNGPKANKYEKAKGIEVATAINNDERGGRAQLIFLDSDPRNADFWTTLGGYQDPNSLPEGPPDEAVEVATTRRLFHISDASGNMEVKEVGFGKLTRETLDANDVYLLHASTGTIFIWVGTGANLAEKKEATRYAAQYLSSQGLPNSTQVVRLSQGNEVAAFKSEFSVWDPPMKLSRTSSGSIAPSSPSSTLSPEEVAAIIRRQAADEQEVDEDKGSNGELSIWVVRDFKKAAVPREDFGEFFGGDSYVLLYKYRRPRRSDDEYLLYFWLGSESSADEKGAAALLAVELDDSLGGKPVQVRVVQGKEPAHFRALFKGAMVVYRGGHTPRSADEIDPQDDNALFHLKGTTATNTAAIQVVAKPSSLNSQDVFLVVTPTKVFIWQGHGANDHELLAGQTVAQRLARKYNMHSLRVGGNSARGVVSVREGEECEEFWQALGGRGDYPKTALTTGDLPREARLFSLSNASGRFRAEEVAPFDQSDLNDEDVFLLDTYTALFLWVGSQANATEKEQSVVFAQEYLRQADDGRGQDGVPILRVQAGSEPLLFTAHFHAWDAEYTKKRVFRDPYAAKLEALQRSKETTPLPASVSTVTVPPPAPAVNFKEPVAGAFSLEELRGNLPTGVDPTRKEDYLSDAEFRAVLGMDRAAFQALAKWRRDDIKKKAGIF